MNLLNQATTVFLSGGKPDLGEFNKDINSLLQAPSWFKPAFYTLVGVYALFMIGSGLFKWVGAKNEHDENEAKKVLMKTGFLAFGIPSVIILVIAIIQWRFNVKLIF